MGNLHNYIGQTKCSPWDSSFCGQCTHLVWWATGNRQNVGDWKKIKTVSSALSLGHITSGDVIATFNGAYGPCGYGGHTAIFHYRGSDGCLRVWHQNWSGVTSISYGTICSYSNYYTVSAVSGSKREAEESH